MSKVKLLELYDGGLQFLITTGGAGSPWPLFVR
ncbi:hypothetical protein FHR55_003519 [Xanthomonas arboricola]